MTEKAKAAHDAWKEADQEAQAVEAQLSEQWKRHDAKLGPPPSAALMAEVSRLRSIANERLTVALRMLGRTD